jgi:hypothetical protein
MVRIWSAVGGVFSITSKLNLSGEEEEPPGGYGEDAAALSMSNALVEGGDDEL